MPINTIGIVITNENTVDAKAIINPSQNRAIKMCMLKTQYSF